MISFITRNDSCPGNFFTLLQCNWPIRVTPKAWYLTPRAIGLRTEVTNVDLACLQRDHLAYIWYGLRPQVH